MQWHCLLVTTQRQSTVWQAVPIKNSSWWEQSSFYLWCSKWPQAITSCRNLTVSECASKTRIFFFSIKNKTWDHKNGLHSQLRDSNLLSNEDSDLPSSFSFCLLVKLHFTVLGTVVVFDTNDSTRSISRRWLKARVKRDSRNDSLRQRARARGREREKERLTDRQTERDFHFSRSLNVYIKHIKHMI